MTQHPRKGYFAISIICVLIYTFLFNTAIVFADEPTPPVTAEETADPPADNVLNDPATESEEVETDEQVEASDTVTTDPTDSSGDEQVPASEEPVPAGEPSDQTPDPDSEAADAPDLVASESEPTLEQLPADTTVVVVVDDQIEPLATQEAAEALALGDPIWCPTGSRPGDAGCTTSYTSFAALLKDLKALNGGTGIDKDGTIWIEDSYDSSVNDVAAGSFVLNGNTLTTWANHSVTLQGGWDGAFDSAGTILSGGVSDFSAPLRILNWNDTVSINDINLSNPTGHGLSVTTTGDINLHNVTSSKNSNGHGAYLSNNSVGSSGNIKVTGSSFNGNSRNGLVANSNGNITLENVTADNNGENGVSLNNRNGTGTISLTGISVNGNTLSGLRAVSKKDVSIASVTATKNSSYGALVNNSTGTGDVKLLSGTNVFTNNTLDGLRVVSAGSITNSGDLTAGNNGQYGVFLGNTLGTGSISLGGTIVVRENTSDGLRAISNSDINVTANLTATDNIRHGVFLNNSTGAGKIAFTGTNIFSGNTLDGLRVISAGNITSTGELTAKNNRFGIYLDNTSGAGSVKLEGTNTFTSNRRDGVFIKTNSGIIIKNATASANKQNGFNVETTNGKTELWCGKSENNDMYGVNVTLNKNLYLFGMEFTGNASGDVNVDGGKVYYADCSGFPCDGSTAGKEKSINVVSVTNTQEAVELSCQLFGGTKLILPNGDFVFIPCPIGDFASLTSLPEQSGAVHALPAGSTFEAGLTLEITAAGGSTSSVDGFITVSFMVPNDNTDADLAILFWNGNEWVEVDNPRKKGDRFEAKVDYAGIFVLVSK